MVDGALRACRADPEIHLLLVGPAETADEVIAQLPAADRGRVDVLPVRQAVGMADHPLRGLRADTTVRAGIAAVVEGRADALVTAGATGATVTAVVHAVGRSPEVRRPALAGVVPALDGPLVLLDLGAGTELSASVLVQHAVLGAAYAQRALRLPEPRVALLSNGTEPGKGDRARRAAEAALRAPDSPLPPGVRFVGGVEGYDVTRGGCADVIVTDGFTGNVVIKAIEGAYALATAHTGRDVSDRVAARAAVLLGVPANVVVCHGAADGAAIASGIALAARLLLPEPAEGHPARAAGPTNLSGTPGTGTAVPGGPGELPAVEVQS